MAILARSSTVDRVSEVFSSETARRIGGGRM